jgi:hypothetical protein
MRRAMSSDDTSRLRCQVLKAAAIYSHMLVCCHCNAQCRQMIACMYSGPTTDSPRQDIREPIANTDEQGCPSNHVG